MRKTLMLNGSYLKIFGGPLKYKVNRIKTFELPLSTHSCLEILNFFDGYLVTLPDQS